MLSYCFLSEILIAQLTPCFKNHVYHNFYYYTAKIERGTLPTIL